MTVAAQAHAWQCQRGHRGHGTIEAHVDLSRPHGYRDLTPIPPELAVRFEMQVFDWQPYAAEGAGTYCPGHDCVSETIVQTGIWEPRETAMALAVMRGHAGEHLIDFGAQVGWFSLLAAACGLRSVAIDADPEPLRLLRASARRNGWADLVDVRRVDVGVGLESLDLPERARLVKVDIEGAEDHAVRLLQPLLDRGAIDHLAIEVSPCFAPWYPELVDGIADAGYEVYRMPDKQVPPVGVESPSFLEEVADVRWVEHQDTVWLRRRGAPW